MLIDNISINDFGCKVMSFDADLTNVCSSDSMWNVKSLIPLSSNFNETYRSLSISLMFKYKKEIAYKKASILIESIKHSVIKYSNLFYSIEINEKNNELQKRAKDIYILNLEFKILNVYEQEKSITTTKNTTININTPKPCYANLELTATTNVITYTVKINDEEITIKNIKANETIYICNGKVVAGGKSKINDVDMWEFPRLKPGTNNIIVNRADISLKIKYNERW